MSSVIPAPSREQRPTRPDPALLETAADALERRLQAPADSAWEVIFRRERARSTVFRIRIVVQGDPVHAFYKAYYLQEPPDQARARRLARYREALAVEARLAPFLVGAFAEMSGRFDEPLALDSEHLVAIRCEVPGRQLGKAISYGVPGRRGLGHRVYSSVGRALRAIEQVGESIPVPDGRTNPEQGILSDLERSGDVLNPLQRRQLERVAFKYLAAIDGRNAFTWSHGDVSPTNVLTDNGRIGVIDFTWGPRLRGRDLAEFVARVETERPRSSRWTKAVVNSALLGYGIDPGAPTPAWCLANLQTAVRALRRRRQPVRTWGERALRELGIGI